jgi:hypothetical protein
MPNNFDALLLFFQEDIVTVRGLIKSQMMLNNGRGIKRALLCALKQWLGSLARGFSLHKVLTTMLKTNAVRFAEKARHRRHSRSEEGSATVATGLHSRRAAR